MLGLVFSQEEKETISYSLPGEETRRQWSANQEEVPHHTQNLLAP